MIVEPDRLLYWVVIVYCVYCVCLVVGYYLLYLLIWVVIKINLVDNELVTLLFKN